MNSINTPQISTSRYSNNSESYRQVALEYYDILKHPTCANFRSATRIVLSKFSKIVLDGATVCEIGAGKSLYAECVPDWRKRNHRLILNDSVSEMLFHSRNALDEGAEAAISDASTLTLPQRADFILCSLGDPYNLTSFWNNCTKILNDDGYLLFTTPSFEWASFFRSPDKTSQTHAEFLLSDGRTVLMPSYIVSEQRQINLVTSAGLVVQEFGHVRISELSDMIISSKLSYGPELAVIDWYLVRK